MLPHMHLRGKDFTYEVEYPDGRAEVLLSVPRYDFNWQSNYRLARPLRLPAGTKIRCTAHFDNSAGNPNNPDAKLSLMSNNSHDFSGRTADVNTTPDDDEAPGIIP